MNANSYKHNYKRITIINKVTITLELHKFEQQSDNKMKVKKEKRKEENNKSKDFLNELTLPVMPVYTDPSLAVSAEVLTSSSMDSSSFSTTLFILAVSRWLSYSTRTNTKQSIVTLSKHFSVCRSLPTIRVEDPGTYCRHDESKKVWWLLYWVQHSNCTYCSTVDVDVRSTIIMPIL